MPAHLKNLFTVRSRHQEAIEGYLDGLSNAVTTPNYLFRRLSREFNQEIRIPLRATEIFPGRPEFTFGSEKAPKHAELESAPTRDSSATESPEKQPEFEFATHVKPKNLHSLIQNRSKAVIVGPPGSGKTEWLRAETHRRIEELQRGDALGIHRLPSFVSLRSVLNQFRFYNPAKDHFRDDALIDAALTFGIKLSRPVIPAEAFAISAIASIFHELPDLRAACHLIAPILWSEWFEKAHENRASLALDGYDETLSQITEDFAIALREFVQKAQTDVIISTRSLPGLEYVFGSENAVEYFEIAPITTQQRDGLIRHLLQGPKAEELQQAVEKIPALDRITLNPLLATLMCLAVANRPSDQKVPENRSDLYKTVTLLLMSQWRDVRGGKDPSPAKRAFLKTKVGFMRQLSAQSVFSRGQDGSGSLDEGKAQKSADEFFKLPENYQILRRNGINCGEELIDSIVRDGILSITGDSDGLDLEVRFIHQTFFEFFLAGFFAENIGSNWRSAQIRAGIGGKNQKVSKVLDQLCWSPEFRETIMLTAAQMKDPSPLVRMLMNPRKDDIHGTRLELAADCICEISEEKRNLCRNEFNRLMAKVLSGGLQKQTSNLVAANPIFRGIKFQEYLVKQLDLREKWWRRTVPHERAVEIAKLSGTAIRSNAGILNKLNETALFASGPVRRRHIGNCGFAPICLDQIDIRYFFFAVKASSEINQKDNPQLARIILHKLRSAPISDYVPDHLLYLLTDFKTEFFSGDDSPRKKLRWFLSELFEDLSNRKVKVSFHRLCRILATGAPFTCSQKIVSRTFELLKTERNSENWPEDFLKGIEAVRAISAGEGNTEVVDALIAQLANAPYSLSVVDMEGLLRSKEQATRVIQMLLSDDDRIREAAARLIIASGKIEDTEVLQTLTSTVERLLVPRTIENVLQGAWIDEQTANSLGFDAFSRDLMTRGLHSQERAALCGAEIIRKMGHPLLNRRVHEKLLYLIEDPRWEVRAAAFHAIAALGAPAGCEKATKAALERMILFGFSTSVDYEEYIAAKTAFGETCSETLVPLVSDGLLRLLESGVSSLSWRGLTALRYLPDVRFSERLRESVWQAIDKLTEDYLYNLVWTSMGGFPASLSKQERMLPLLLSALHRFAAREQNEEYYFTVRTISDLGLTAGNDEGMVDYFLSNFLKGKGDECRKLSSWYSYSVLEKILSGSENAQLLNLFAHYYYQNLKGEFQVSFKLASEEEHWIVEHGLKEVLLAFSPRAYSRSFLEILFNGIELSRSSDQFAMKIARKAGSDLNSALVDLASDMSLPESVRRQIVDLLRDRGFRIFSKLRWHQKLEPVIKIGGAIVLLSLPVALALLTLLRFVFPEVLIWTRETLHDSSLSYAFVASVYVICFFVIGIQIANMCSTQKWRIESVEKLSHTG